MLRVGKNGLNLLQFRDTTDIEIFCTNGATETDESAYRSRVGYVSDYLYGFDSDADENGYPMPNDKTSAVPRFFGMWIPGNGLNHRLQPNTVYRPAQGGTDEGISLVALTPIKRDDELVDDYRRHGTAPQWTLDFASQHQVTLNFAECNDFVVDPTRCNAES